MPFSSSGPDLLAVLRASQAMSGETDLDRLRDAIVGQLSTLTGATTVGLALRDHDTRHWFVPGDPPVPLVEADRLVPLTAFRYVERGGATLLVPDAAADDRFAADPFVAGRRHCALLVVPILRRGALRAVVFLTNDRTEGEFTADGLDSIELLANQLAVSLDNALLFRSLEDRVDQRTRELAAANRKLEILGSADALTTLPSRQRFTEILDREWARAFRNTQPIGIVIIDIDHFKRYNDHYGHLGGDECLRRVAAAVRDGALRATDLVCRYGGEEFAVVLPETSHAGTRTVAERVRQAVEALALPHALADSGIVTVSVGYASMVPTRAAEPETLVRAADDALFEAKGHGRNRVRGLRC